MQVLVWLVLGHWEGGVGVLGLGHWECWCGEGHVAGHVCGCVCLGGVGGGGGCAPLN